MNIRIISEVRNVAPRFHKALWRKYRIERIYKSVADARRFHNLSRCNYIKYRINKYGEEEIIDRVNNIYKFAL